MLLLNLDHAARYYGTRPVFTGLSWAIQDDARTGLIGPNGAGKSTLLRLLAGAEPADEGQVVARKGLRLALLPQDVPAPPGETPLTVALGARPDLLALEARLAEVEAGFADPAAATDPDRWDELVQSQARLLEEYESAGGPRLRNEATGLLRRLGFDAALQDAALATLSGGQRKLAYLARCLLAEPELLLLDEPDNHLDLEGKAFLTAVIGDFEGAVVIISHDRYLLDDTVTSIAELADGALTLWEGNYSAYAVQKGAHAAAPTGAVHGAAKGDQAARRGGRALQALGEPRHRRAPYQTGAQ